PAAVRGYLKLQPEAGMFRLDRMFTLQNLPVVYASSFLPRNVFKGLDRFPRETSRRHSRCFRSKCWP
nr:UTRA domain-containing protein [Desulfobacterales bacterium]